LRPSGALERLTRLLARAAAVFLGAMMMATVADVVLRSLFAYPIFGTFDLVELFLVTLIFLGLPETFRREEHVAVDVVDHLAPERAVALLRILGALLAVALLALMLWHSVPPARDTYVFGDRTLDLGLPRYLHWIPILLGIAAAILAALAVLARSLRAARDLWARR
jgi:TRAP-type C4-dicarboxylate transport system permease small subunit